MDYDLVSKNEVRNIILAAQQAATELAKRAPSSVEVETYLDGFITALNVISTGLGITVDFERTLPKVPREWREVWDIFPTSTVDQDLLAEKGDE